MPPILSVSQAIDFLVLGAKTTLNHQPHFAPIVVCQHTDGTVIPMLLAVEIDELATAVASALAAATVAPLHFASLSIDSYYAEADPRTAVPGELAQRFAQGDAAVSEAVIIYIAFKGGSYNTTLRYKRNADDTVTWSEPTTVESLASVYPAALRFAVRRSQVDS
jgi:hypothetical protein